MSESILTPRLTPPQERALIALRDLCDAPHGTAQVPWGYASPRDVAQVMWPDSEGWEHRSRRGATPAGGAMGATMPMKAATVLWRLHTARLAWHDSLRSRPWSITPAGRAYLAEWGL